jgi:hypothetical protein
MTGFKSKRMLTDRQPQVTDDEQDDMTLVYMWAFKKGEESAKARIEQLTSGPGGIMEMKQTIADKEKRNKELEAALRRIEDENNYGSDGCWVADSYPDEIARAALGEKKDENLR